MSDAISPASPTVVTRPSNDALKQIAIAGGISLGLAVTSIATSVVKAYIDTGFSDAPTWVSVAIPAIMGIASIAQKYLLGKAKDLHVESVNNALYTTPPMGSVDPSKFYSK